jgi:hypothetical protein
MAFVLEEMDEFEWYPKKTYSTREQAEKAKKKYEAEYQKWVESTPKGSIMRSVSARQLGEEAYRIKETGTTFKTTRKKMSMSLLGRLERSKKSYSLRKVI